MGQLFLSPQYETDMTDNKMRHIYQLNSELFKVTGIQRVLMDIHEALRGEGAKIVGTVSFDKVNPDLHIRESDYMQMKGYRMFRNAVVIIHERRYLPIFWFLNKVLRYNVKVIYVHHNELYGQKLLSRFPDHVVAISDAGIRNLVEYFGVPRKHITKIHNCVRQPDGFSLKRKEFDPDHITILYPARINTVKQQVEIVRMLKGKLDSRIRILFAGIGPAYEELKTACAGSRQFVALGFRDDVMELMQKVDFMMLFSKHEGLPISLIEATMTGTPIICNDVGGNTEIAIDNKNAIVINDWEQLIECLNALPTMSADKYLDMTSSGREVYETMYRFSTFANDYKKMIESLTKN